MFFLSVIVIITLVTILHLLLHFVVRKDNLLVVFGSVVFDAISMAAVYYFVISQWDIEGYGRITVPLITYIVAEVFYLVFTARLRETDIGKSVEGKLEKINEQHKGDLKYAFWYALSGADLLPATLGCATELKVGQCFAVPFWPFINSKGEAEVHWGDSLRIYLIQHEKAAFTGLRWSKIEGQRAIFINGKVATFG